MRHDLLVISKARLAELHRTVDDHELRLDGLLAAYGDLRNAIRRTLDLADRWTSLPVAVTVSIIAPFVNALLDEYEDLLLDPAEQLRRGQLAARTGGGPGGEPQEDP